MPGKPGCGGKPGRSGRKPKQVELKLAELLDTAWPEQDRLSALRKLAEMANAGDKESLKLLLAYSYGRPKERVEHSGVDGEPIKYLVGVSESDL